MGDPVDRIGPNGDDIAAVIMDDALLQLGKALLGALNGNQGLVGIGLGKTAQQITPVRPPLRQKRDPGAGALRLPGVWV